MKLRSIDVPSSLDRAHCWSTWVQRGLLPRMVEHLLQTLQAMSSKVSPALYARESHSVYARTLFRTALIVRSKQLQMLQST